MGLLRILVAFARMGREVKIFNLDGKPGVLGFYTISVVMFCIICFCTRHLVLFYFFFERRGVPMLIILLSYGTSPERFQARLYMVLYLFFGSLPMLLVIIVVCTSFCRDSLLVVSNLGERYFRGRHLLWGFLLAAVLIKRPIYLAHAWLTKAHVEAPTGGSTLLAGVLLKLRVVGMLRLSGAFGVLPLRLCISLIGIYLCGSLFCSLICMGCHDTKLVVAYSSVVHMGLSIRALLISIGIG